MLRLASYDIVFQEVPGEVSLALNIAGCPNACPGCHSPHLQQDSGEVLDQELLQGLLTAYGEAITCVCFMGGDSDTELIGSLCSAVRANRAASLKTAWYTGLEEAPRGFPLSVLDFLKTGPYRKELGGLDSPSTNQRFYRMENNRLIDITGVFR